MLMRLTNHEMVAHDPTLLLLRSAIALELVPGPDLQSKTKLLIGIVALAPMGAHAPKDAPMKGEVCDLNESLRMP